MKEICVLTGAGMSAESGIRTFRDADGLWEGHDVMQVASPEGWARNRELVLDFYNQRRRQLFEVQPNSAHKALVTLEESFNTTIITQNVDNLHERAGSSYIIHLHGELCKVRSEKNPDYVVDWYDDLTIKDHCPDGGKLRPHIVWFGEAVPMLESAIPKILTADIIIIIGTSMQVYPAASLTAYANDLTSIYYIDPSPKINYELGKQRERLTIIEKNALEGVPDLVNKLISEA